MSDLKNLMSVSDFAIKNKVSTVTVYKWIEKGWIESVKVGKMTFVDTSKPIDKSKQN